MLLTSMLILLLSTIAVFAVHNSTNHTGDGLFEATYVGRFKYLKRHCEGPNSVVRASCAEEIEILSTSHPALNCSAPFLDQGYSVVECTGIDANTGTDIFEDDYDVQLYGLGGVTYRVFVEIEFACRGEQSVDAALFYLDSGDGSCGSNSYLRSFNAHLAQLGIMCNDEYSFDYHNVKCSEGWAVDVGNVAKPNEDFEGVYACISGAQCSKCQVNFTDVVINVRQHHLRAECIKSLDGGDLPVQNAPAPVPVPAGEHSATFQVGWALALISRHSSPVEPISARIQCENGRIKLLQTLHDGVSCSETQENTLTCSEGTGDWGYGGKFVDTVTSQDYSGILFECTSSDEVPRVSAELDPISISTVLYQSSMNYYARLRLSPLCRIEERVDPEFYFTEDWVICGDRNYIDMPQDPFGTFGTWVCFDMVTAIGVPDGQVSVETEPVFIQTDYKWTSVLEYEDWECINQSLPVNWVP